MAGPEAGLRPPGIGTDQPDNSVGIVGREGIPVKQDIDGTQIQRLGIAGADADWGPGAITLSADGEAIIADPEGVGGTRSSAGYIKSQDAGNLSVVYVWSDENGGITSIADAEASDTAVVERPPGGQSDTEIVIEDVSTKSDNAIVFVEDNSSAENTFEYTLNFH